MFFDADGKVVADSQMTMKAMPVFLGQLLPVGIIGLVAAGMIAAFMSTHDTYLLCWASVLTEDVANPLADGRMSQAARLLLTRILLVVIASFLVVWSLYYPLDTDLWDYMAVSGAIYFTGAFAIMLAGLYWKRASRAGAFLALSAGLFAVLGLEPVQRVAGVFDVFTKHGVTGAHVGLSTTGLAVILMLLGSVAFPDRDGEEGGSR